MATKKTIQLEVDTNSQDAQKQFDGLRKSIKETQQELEKFTGTEKENSKEADNLRKQLADLDVEYGKLSKSNTDLGATFEDVFGEVKPLTAQMGEMEDRLYQMALAGDTASKEYKELLTEVGKYKRIQQDTDMIVDGAATTMSQKLGGAIQGVAGGFAVAQGAMALMGTESEKFEETMIKLNAAMAISQGIAGLGESKKAFKAMGLSAKTALKGIKTGVAATGIGVFLVLLGGVVAYWDDIKNLVTDIGAEQKQLNVLIEDDLTLQQGKLDAIGGQENILKEQGKSEKDILKLKIAQTDEVIAATEKSIAGKKIAAKLEIQAIRRNQKVAEATAKVALTMSTALLRILTTPLDAVISVVNAASKFLGGGKIISLNLNKTLNNLIKKGSKLAAGMLFDPAAAQKESNEQIKIQEKALLTLKNNRAGFNLALRSGNTTNSKDSAAEQLAIARELEDLKISQLKDGYDKQVILINTFHKRIREDTLANEKLTEQQKTDLLVEQEEIRQGKIIALGDRRGEVEFTKMEVRGVQELELHEKIEDGKLQITKDYDATRKAQAKETAQAMANIAIDGLRLVSDIADLMSKGDRKKQKRAFNIKKAADIAEATMSGYKAVITTFANAPGGVVLKGIQAGIAGAFSAVQIAKIASAKFEGGDVPSDLADAPSGDGGGGGGAAQPSFNVVGDSGMNQLAQLQMQPTQAFVVSGDITTAQSLDRNKIQNATI